ncbi:MAG: hypothetical protein R3E79_56330 [Caldilineaceae bacterium]
MAFHPDGSTLASGAFDQKLCFWSITTGQSLNRQRRAIAIRSASIDYSPDGKTLVNSSAEHIHLWHGATGRLQQPLRGHTNRIRCVVFGPLRKDASTAGRRRP